MKKKTFFKRLLAIAYIAFAAVFAVVTFPETLIPLISDTLHISVDTLTAFVQFFGGQSAGMDVSMAACTLTGFVETCDDDGNIAGIESIWFTEKNNISALTISGRQITAVTMVSGKVFYKWTFEPDTAFFNQPKTVTSRVPFIKQNIQFSNSKMKTTLISALEALDNCAQCGLVAIVKDNNGKFWVLGVKLFANGSYSFVGVYPAQSDGAVTGANPEGDQNKVTTAFEAKTGKFAIESTIAEGSIPV